MIRKDLVIAILAILCVATSLFLVVKSTRSQTSSVRQYDTWLDTNGDGVIDGSDISSVARLFGAGPGDTTRDVNVTNWPSPLVSYPMRNPTEISLGQQFNWSVGEIIEVQGNLYVYQGYTQITGMSVMGYIGEWQNGWITLTYCNFASYYQVSYTLSPYILRVTYGPTSNCTTCVLTAS
jgi:hypothetical protein